MKLNIPNFSELKHLNNTKIFLFSWITNIYYSSQTVNGHLMQSLSLRVVFEGIQNNRTSGSISQSKDKQTLDYLSRWQKEFANALPNIQKQIMANETLKQLFNSSGQNLLQSNPKCVLSSPVLRSIEISIPERLSLTINITIADSSIDVLTQGEDQVSKIPTSMNFQTI